MQSLNQCAEEEWRPVPDPLYSEHYHVSSLGRVRRVSVGPKGNKPGLKTPTRAGKWGHLKTYLYAAGHAKSFWVHRLVALAFCGQPPTPKHEVAHNDGNAANNRADNLRWATSAENKADARRHGRMVVGERHYMAKLTEEQVREIRRTYKRGTITQKAIAARLGVHRVLVSKVVLGKIWRHVDASVDSGSS